MTMRSGFQRCFLLMSLICAASVPLAAQKRIIRHEDVFLMKRVGEPIISPDGRLAVFSLTEPDYDPAKQTVDLWLVPVDGSAPARRLTSTQGGGIESHLFARFYAARILGAARRGRSAPDLHSPS